MMRWKADGGKLQKQYDKLKKRGQVEHIEIFEIGFEPLLVEVAPIRVDNLPAMSGPNDAV